MNMDTRFFVLGVIAAVLFGAGGLVLTLAWLLLHELRRAPGAALYSLFGKPLQRRSVVFCEDCETAHVVPPLARGADGAPDWSRSMREAKLIEREPLETLVHRGAPLLILAERIAQREARTFYEVLVSWMNAEDRTAVRAALNGEREDDLVSALHDEDHDEVLRALEARNAEEARDVAASPLAA